MHWTEITIIAVLVLAALPVVIFVVQFIRGIVHYQRYEKPVHDRIDAELPQLRVDVDGLSVDDAAAAVERMRVEHTHEAWSFTEAPPAANEWLATCGPRTRAFFDRYAKVECAGCGLRREQIRPYEWDNGDGYIELGDEGDGHTFVVAKPSDDKVYVVANDCSYEEHLTDRFDTIYHYTLYQLRVDLLVARSSSSDRGTSHG